MNAVILLSLVIASAMAAPMPQILAPGLTLQSAGGVPTTFLTSSPQLFTTQQFVQQPSFLAPTAQQQEEALEAQEAQAEARALQRDPTNPTTDIFLHSGFPLVSQLSGVQQSPFTLSAASPLTTVGISSAAQPQAQSAQLVQAPVQQQQSAQLVQAPQPQATQFFTTSQQLQTQQAVAPQQQVQPATFSFQPFQTASIQQSQPQQQQQAVQQPAAAAAPQFSSGPLIFTAQQPSTLTGFRTVATPFTLQTIPTL